MFELIKKSLEETTAARLAKKIAFIKTGTEENPDRGIKLHSTDTRWAQYQNGEITREQIIKYTINRITRESEKHHRESLARLDRIAAVPDCNFISVSVDWVRSSVWGYNPHANIITERERATGSASGCGYDKRSAAVAEAFDNIDSIIKILCEIKEKALSEGKTDRPEKDPTYITNCYCCGYGAGYSVIPSFEGGVGVDCFWRILENAGFKCYADESGKYSDHYTIIREGV